MGLLNRGEHRALICGHTHLPGVVDVDGGAQYVNAGTWGFGHSHFASWDGTELSVSAWETGAEIRDEHYRWMLTGHAPGDFFVWWQKHHRGWLRFAW